MRLDVFKRAIAEMLDEVTAARRRREQLEHYAYHDELTGLANRYLLRDRLEQAIAQAQRRAHRFAVVFVDVDRFKLVNDSFGHGVGDELLKHIGARLAATLRAGDTAARLGGDEFVLLLFDASDPAAILGTIARIDDVLRRPVTIEGHRLATSCSVGFSLFPRDGADAPSLLRHADLAMYARKSAARVNPQGLFPLQIDTGESHHVAAS